jgi:hypothetical protein
MTAATAKRPNGRITSDVIDIPTHGLTVPVRELRDVSDAIVLGFYQNMLTCGEQGAVDVGAGCGTDFITLRWGDRRAMIRGSDLLRSWVATFAPDDAARMGKA